MFYQINPKYRQREMSVEVRAVPEWDDYDYASLVDGHYKADITFPVHFYLYENEQFFGKQHHAGRDFLLDCWRHSYPMLISNWFKEQLETHQITGWKTYPAILLDPAGNEVSPPHYHGFTITGRCAPRKLFQEDGVTYRDGIHIDPASWDGSDIFIEAHYPSILITARAKKVFKAQNVMQVTPALDAAPACYFKSVYDIDVRERRAGIYQPRCSLPQMTVAELIEQGVLTPEEADKMVHNIDLVGKQD